MNTVTIDLSELFDDFQRQINELRSMVIHLVTAQVASGEWSPNKAREVLCFPLGDDV